MERPLQITFHGIDHSATIASHIQTKVAGLERYYGRITGCHVTVEAAHHHHHKGNLYNVRVNLHVPGKEIVAVHEHSQDHAHEDVYVALRDAFDAVTRQLEDHIRVMRGDVKTHTPGPP